MHPLLQRQLKRLGLDDVSRPPSIEVWTRFCERISQTYVEAEQGRTLLERSLALSSQEMRQLHEDLIQSSERRIKNIEDHTQHLIAASLDGIVGMDAEGRVTAWNPQAAHLFGWTKEEILGKPLADTIVPKQHRAAHQQGLRRFVNTKVSRLLNQRLEMSALHRNGQEFPIELTIIPLEQDDTLLFYAFVRDLTRQKSVEEHLRKAKEEAETTTRTKSEFLATMSHEIRTPMNGVIGMTGLLLETALTPQQRQYAETVRNSGEALLTIINDILDFSKIEAGKLEFETIDFDLRMAVEETLELLAEKAGSKKLELLGLVSAQVPTALQGDPGRFRQVLLNLISNAIKFTSQGEVIIHVSLVSETETRATIKVEVRDTGMGIPEDKQAKLFQPFSQADSSTTRQFGGTGLGLAICRQLVELMGGSIGLDSHLEQGSTFWFTAEFSKQPPVSIATLPPMPLQGYRLFCVDNHPATLDLLTQYAQGWGMEVTSSSSPAEALALLQSSAKGGRPFDLAIIDMDMPGMDGIKLARVLKSHTQLSSIPLILLTSLGRHGETQLTNTEGFADHLTKPIRKEALETCLQTVLGLQMPETDRPTVPLTISFSAPESDHRSNCRVLVADDHQVNQQLAVLMLDRMGFRCDVVGNGREALEATLKIPYALILMDCHMPEMDGYEATRAIRRHEELRAKNRTTLASLSGASPHARTRIPIVALTANAMQGDKEKCLQAGMDDYLAKPIRPESLHAILKKWLPATETDTPSSSHASTPHVATPTSFDPDMVAQWQTLGGPDLFARMVNQFVRDAIACVNTLESACASNNPEQLRDAAHGLKGICRNMGANGLAELASAIERECQDRIPANIPQTISSIRTAITHMASNENQYGR